MRFRAPGRPDPRRTRRRLRRVGERRRRSRSARWRTPEFEGSPPRIQHRDRQRAVTVSAFVRTGFNTDRVTKQVLAAARLGAVPGGVRLVAGGELESRQRASGASAGRSPSLRFGCSAVLVLEFRTFRST